MGECERVWSRLLWLIVVAAAAAALAQLSHEFELKFGQHFGRGGAIIRLAA